jgi:hypothetical protein
MLGAGFQEPDDDASLMNLARMKAERGTVRANDFVVTLKLPERQRLCRRAGSGELLADLWEVSVRKAQAWERSEAGRSAAGSVIFGRELEAGNRAPLMLK